MAPKRINKSKFKVVQPLTPSQCILISVSILLCDVITDPVNREDQTHTYTWLPRKISFLPLMWKVKILKSKVVPPLSMSSDRYFNFFLCDGITDPVNREDQNIISNITS